MAAIQGGTMTFEALRREIGVGTGNCKAKRCRTNIEDRIQCHKDSLKEAPVEPEGPSGQTHQLHLQDVEVRFYVKEMDHHRLNLLTY